MGYKYLFGPVPLHAGWALLSGSILFLIRSAPSTALYCECGETNTLTVTRGEYVPFQAVVDELDHFLAKRPHPDFVTFSGYGEPTLHSRIGDVIAHIKSGAPELKVAVLTNGTLLHDPQVRRELMSADLVLPVS